MLAIAASGLQSVQDANSKADADLTATASADAAALAHAGTEKKVVHSKLTRGGTVHHK